MHEENAVALVIGILSEKLECPVISEIPTD